MPKPSPCDVGAANELSVAADLIRRGYDVFRNMSPNGQTDLLAMRDGIVLRVQVKSAHVARAESNDVLAVYKQGNLTYKILHFDAAARQLEESFTGKPLSVRWARQDEKGVGR